MWSICMVRFFQTFFATFGAVLRISCSSTKGEPPLPLESREVLPGTLDLMVLKTLDTLGPTHGYGIAQRIIQISYGILDLNQGSLYPALLRMEQRGWIESGYGMSENNRKARFYSLTPSGRKRLKTEIDQWLGMVAIMQRLIEGNPA
jgi:PadR family transcriptional regulator, regulatory protein PadR